MMGAILLDLLILIVCVVLLTEQSFFKGVSRGGHKVYESARQMRYAEDQSTGTQAGPRGELKNARENARRQNGRIAV